MNRGSLTTRSTVKLIWVSPAKLAKNGQCFSGFFRVAWAILGVRYLSTALACGGAAFLGSRGWQARNSQGGSAKRNSKGGSATRESDTEVPHSKGRGPSSRRMVSVFVVVSRWRGQSLECDISTLGVRYLSTALACGEAAFLGSRGWQARNSQGGSATRESGTEVPHSKGRGPSLAGDTQLISCELKTARESRGQRSPPKFRSRHRAAVAGSSTAWFVRQLRRPADLISRSVSR